MAKFKMVPTVNVDGYFTAKVKGDITDADISKSVKVSVDTTDTYELCGDGDGIDAFIVGVDPATADGLHLCTLNEGGLVQVESDGTATVGDLVEAAAQAAAGTAETNGLGMISTHAVDTTSAATLAASTFDRNWQIVSATTTDGSVAAGDTKVVIKRV